MVVMASVSVTRKKPLAGVTVDAAAKAALRNDGMRARALQGPGAMLSLVAGATPAEREKVFSFMRRFTRASFTEDVMDAF